MTKIYMFEMSVYVAVAAKDADHAMDLADEYMFQRAVSDSPECNIELLREIKTLDELERYDWDGMCIPYGDTGGNTRLKDVLT